jgi:hypothetical protein
MAQKLPERGLLIRSEPIKEILTGRKVWEIRGGATNVRGRIALIRSKSGLIVGTCNVVEVVGPLTLAELRVLCNADGSPLTPKMVSDRVRKAAKISGVGRC